jgi:hypothetical protein
MRKKGSPGDDYVVGRGTSASIDALETGSKRQPQRST